MYLCMYLPAHFHKGPRQLQEPPDRSLLPHFYNTCAYRYLKTLRYNVHLSVIDTCYFLKPVSATEEIMALADSIDPRSDCRRRAV